MSLKWKSWELFNCSFDIGLINNLVLSWCSSWPCVGPPQFASGFRFVVFSVWQDSKDDMVYFITSPSSCTFLFSTFIFPLICSSLSVLFLLYCESWSVCSSQLLAVVLHNWPCVWDLSVIHSSSFAVGCTVHTYKPNVWRCWFQSLLCLITVEVSTRLVFIRNRDDFCECSGCG